MEASALTIASRSGLLPRRSPLLRLQSDEKLVALIRDGHDRAFEVLFDRYQSRLLAFCHHLVGSLPDAEDVLQEVFVSAHTAMLADERPINARPWLYRIARNRCLNFLRKPGAEARESMDAHAHANGTTTLEEVQSREELRAIFADVHELPETQRTALVLREIDDLSYTEIAQAMSTTLPSVKSLLVRARMSLAESSEARILTCDDVRLELAEAAEGLSKASGPVRRHVRVCPGCQRYRNELRSSSRALGALAPPLGLFLWLRRAIGAKVGGGSAGAGSAATGGAGSAGGAAAAAGGSTFGSAAAAAGSGVAGIGGAIGAKAAVGMATAALITAGAVGVKDLRGTGTQSSDSVGSSVALAPVHRWEAIHKGPVRATIAAKALEASSKPAPAAPATPADQAATTPAVPPPAPAPAADPAPAPAPAPTDTSTTDSSAAATSGDGSTVGGSSTGDGTTTVVVPLPTTDPVPVTPPDDRPPPPDSTSPDPVTLPDATSPPPDSPAPAPEAPATTAAVTYTGS